MIFNILYILYIFFEILIPCRLYSLGLFPHRKKVQYMCVFYKGCSPRIAYKRIFEKSPKWLVSKEAAMIIGTIIIRNKKI